MLLHPSSATLGFGKLTTQAFVLQITIVEGPALTSLHHLLQQPDGPNTFDFAFIGEL